MIPQNPARLNPNSVGSRISSSTHSRLSLFRPVHSDTKEVEIPSHAFLRSLSKDELIDVCFDAVMGRVHDRLQLTNERLSAVEDLMKVMEEKELVVKDLMKAVEEKELVVKDLVKVTSEKEVILRDMLKKTEDKRVVDLQLLEYFHKFNTLRVKYLRQDDQFNLRGIIEYIASTSKRELYDVQSNLNILVTTKTFQPCLQAVSDRLQLPIDVLSRTCQEINGVLSKHFHYHHFDGHTNDIVIDTTPSSEQVLSVWEGAALEVFMQYAMIPYIAICKDKAIRFDVVRPGQLMVGIELPLYY